MSIQHRRLQRQVDQLRADNARLRSVLVWLDRIGGLGLQVHARITDALAATPAQALAAHDAVVKAAALRAGQLRGALFEVLDGIGALGGKAYELEGYGISADRAREIVRIVESSPAQSTATHDAALLRDVATRLFDPDGDTEEKEAAERLLAEADRIEKEAGRAG